MRDRLKHLLVRKTAVKIPEFRASLLGVNPRSLNLKCEVVLSSGRTVRIDRQYASILQTGRFVIFDLVKEFFFDKVRTQDVFFKVRLQALARNPRFVKSNYVVRRRIEAAA